MLTTGLVASATARASSGTVVGRFTWQQQQRNCGTGSGAKFPCAWVNTVRPIRHVTIKVYRASDDKFLGDGYSNDNGDWSVAWADTSSSGNVTIKVKWHPNYFHDDRFRVTPSDAMYWTFGISGTYSAVNGGTTSMGTSHYGSNAILDYWDGAVMMWRNALRQSSYQVDNFGMFTPSGSGATRYVRIRLNVDTGNCDTGLARADLNRICLPSYVEGMNQSRVMHEMGHIAEAISAPGRSHHGVASYDYNDPTTSSDGGWGPTSQEYYSVQFSEAVATAMASVALYQPGATEPRTCIASATCSTSLETSLASCSTEKRWPLSAERYFWDIYDTDSSGGDGVESPIYNWVLALGQYWSSELNRTSNGGKDECWDADYEYINDPEGRSILDFEYHHDRMPGTPSTYTAVNMNCRPSGGSPAVD